MEKVVYGFCPTLNREYSISVSVIPTGTLENPNSYELGLIDCQHAGFNECKLAKENQLNNFLRVVMYCRT